jgi:hypothetical protein
MNIPSPARTALLFAIFASSAHAQPASPPKSAAPSKVAERQEAFAKHRQSVSSALAVASQCVAGAPDNKAIRQCVETLHASIPRKPTASSPKPNEPRLPGKTSAPQHPDPSR